jgi:hypothetical protein
MKSKTTRVAFLFASAIVTAVAQDANSEKDLVPNGRRMGTLLNPNNAHNPEPPGLAGKPLRPGGNGISYHGGPVMTSGIRAYFIWYGDWTTSVAPILLENLVANIGKSGYWNINSTYYQNNDPAQSVSLEISVRSYYPTDKYALGKTLTDSNIATIVSNAISGGLPLDANGVYFVLTSADVTASSGFCNQYCGWHTYGTLSGMPIKYSFVGDSSRCPSSCQAQATGPNGASGADGMASIIVHELEEAATDPQLNAWYDTRGYENADKCAWTFGTTQNADNGAKYNVTVGAKQYLIQQNWVNAAGGKCAMSN